MLSASAIVQGMHIITSRTLVRPFHDSDLKPLTRMMTDEEVMRFTGFKVPQTEERIRELLAKWKLDGDSSLGVWAAEDQESQAFVAWFMLKKTVTNDPELGFMLEKKFWNKGYATEISLAFINHAFTVLKIGRVIASTTPENHASIKVLRKIGMTEYEENASKHPVIYFEILRPA